LTASSDELNGVRAEIQKMLDGASGSGGRATTSAEAARIARVRDETTTRLQAVGSLRDRVTTLMNEAEAGLIAEDKAEAGRNLAEGSRRRAKVAGLIGELDMRLHPAGGTTLAGVKREASGLRKSLSNLNSRKDYPTQEEVVQARGELAGLVAKAEAQESESRRQWSVFERLDQAFQGVKFHRDGRVEMPAPGNSVHASHSTREADVVATISSQVDPNGSIHIEMRGSSDTGSITLPPDDHCPDRLIEIAMQARNKGLIIEKVLCKGPDGWHEMSLPGISQEEQIKQGNTAGQGLEARL
jgi:hypothetical protein